MTWRQHKIIFVLYNLMMIAGFSILIIGMPSWYWQNVLEATIFFGSLAFIFVLAWVITKVGSKLFRKVWG